MKRVIVLVALLAVIVGSGGYAVAQVRQPRASYSTAKATLANVERTLDLSGTVTAAGRRDLALGTDGTVTRVPVRAGQRVRKGQVLARLDTSALAAAVTSAAADLARAKAQLASDEDAQANTVSAAASSSGTGKPTQKPQPAKPSAPSTPSKPDPALQQALADLASGQKAVTAAQSEASDAITAARAALSAEAQACQASHDPDRGDAAACTSALGEVQDAQDTVAAKQDALQSALADLTSALTKGITAVTKASRSSSRSSSQSSGQGSPTGQSQGAPAASVSTVSPSSTSSASSGQDGSSDGTVTAARLAQDQADIDTAGARLDEADAARGLAVLRAPYAGRLLQVDVARGDQVASSDTAVVLVGKGVTTVTTTVSNAQVPDVRRGESVTVTPAGWTTSLRGTVSAIGLMPDSSGDFPVTVTVESGRTVAEGSTASVAIVTGVARHAVTVPTSAITKAGTRAVVRVLDGDTLTRSVVTVGVVGQRRVSITQGLRVGATVVLGDLSAAVPSSTTGTNNRNGFGGAGLEQRGPVVVQRGG